MLYHVSPLCLTYGMFSTGISEWMKKILLGTSIKYVREKIDTPLCSGRLRSLWERLQICKRNRSSKFGTSSHSESTYGMGSQKSCYTEKQKMDNGVIIAQALSCVLRKTNRKITAIKGDKKKKTVSNRTWDRI